MRPGQRPEHAWSFLPPYRDKPLPAVFSQKQEAEGSPADRTPPAFRPPHASPAPPPSPVPDHIVLARGAYKPLEEWCLVLDSQNIPYHFEQSQEGPWILQVPFALVEPASLQIRLYREENPEKPTHAPLPALRWSLQPLWVLLIPLIGTFWQFSTYGSLHSQGVAVAHRIVQGDWWRIFTALTLHADSGHLLSNLVSGYLVLALLAVRLPLTRMVPWLVFAAGIANLGVAWTVQSNFRSLGFSTFVFAALGALGTVEMRVKPPGFDGILRRLAPCIAVLALAMLMGLGHHSDILAHFYGLGAGLAVGFLPSKRQLQWGSPIDKRDGWILLSTYTFFVYVWLRATVLPNLF